MEHSSTGNTDNIETKKLSDYESYSFEINGETFIYPENILDIVKFYNGEIGFDEFYEKYKSDIEIEDLIKEKEKNNNYKITIGKYFGDNKIICNFNEEGIKYFNKNISLNNFLKYSKEKFGKYYKFDINGNIKYLTQKQRNEFACMLHFLENKEKKKIKDFTSETGDNLIEIVNE